MDLTSILGIVIGLGCILTAQMFEGGNIGQLLQLTAGMIVFAVQQERLLEVSASVLKEGVEFLKFAFMKLEIDYDKVISEIVGYAKKARKEGVISSKKKLEMQVTRL